jgi:hypothetical protein
MITSSQFVQGIYQAKRLEILDCRLELEYFGFRREPIVNLQS